VSRCVMLVGIGLTFCHCDDDKTKTCDERGGVAMGNFDLDPAVAISSSDGSTLSVRSRYADLLVPLQRGRSSQLATFGLVVTATSGTSYAVGLPLVEGELLVTSSTGERFLIRGAEATLQKDTNVCTRTKLDATIEILAARGRVDSGARTVDGSFWRRVAIYVDWPALGCGLGAIRGSVIVDLVAALGANCEDTFQRIGPIEGVPPDGGSPDGEAGKADAGN
jgi:hypothetical protein